MVQLGPLIRKTPVTDPESKSPGSKQPAKPQKNFCVTCVLVCYMVCFCVWCALGTARGSGPEQHGGATTKNLKGKKCVLIALQLIAYVKV